MFSSDFMNASFAHNLNSYFSGTKIRLASESKSESEVTLGDMGK